MRTLTATEASRGFSRLLDEVAHGEKVRVTRDGVVVATMGPPEISTGADLTKALGPGAEDPTLAEDIADVLSAVTETWVDPWAES